MANSSLIALTDGHVSGSTAFMQPNACPSHEVALGVKLSSTSQTNVLLQWQHDLGKEQAVAAERGFDTNPRLEDCDRTTSSCGRNSGGEVFGICCTGERPLSSINIHDLPLH